MIAVVNVKQSRPDGMIYIGRTMPGFAGSVLGNPHGVGYCRLCRRQHTREEALEAYRAWLRAEWCKNGDVRAELERLADLSETQDLVLACWCKPLSCHGDVVKEAVEGIRKRRAPSEGGTVGQAIIGTDIAERDA
jgi:hypothetical protein